MEWGSSISECSGSPHAIADINITAWPCLSIWFVRSPDDMAILGKTDWVQTTWRRVLFEHVSLSPNCGTASGTSIFTAHTSSWLTNSRTKLGHACIKHVEMYFACSSDMVQAYTWCSTGFRSRRIVWIHATSWEGCCKTASTHRETSLGYEWVCIISDSIIYIIHFFWHSPGLIHGLVAHESVEVSGNSGSVHGGGGRSPVPVNWEVIGSGLCLVKIGCAMVGHVICLESDSHLVVFSAASNTQLPRESAVVVSGTCDCWVGRSETTARCWSLAGNILFGDISIGWCLGGWRACVIKQFSKGLAVCKRVCEGICLIVSGGKGFIQNAYFT